MGGGVWRFERWDGEAVEAEMIQDRKLEKKLFTWLSSRGDGEMEQEKMDPRQEKDLTKDIMEPPFWDRYQDKRDITHENWAIRIVKLLAQLMYLHR